MLLNVSVLQYGPVNLRTRPGGPGPGDPDSSNAVVANTNNKGPGCASDIRI